MSYSVGLYTLGCKVSQYETEAVAEEFVKLGFTVLGYSDICDVYVVNTCTVTAESDRKSRQIIRRAIQRNPNAVIIVMGCYSQTSPEEVSKIRGVSYICGTDGKTAVAEKALQLLKQRNDDASFACICDVSSLDGVPFEQMSISHAPRTRAYVKIEDGCECRCTYCAIPNARGGVRSKAPDDVLKELSVLADNGVREVVLTGIETASYGHDLGGYRLIDLLERIERESNIERIRLGSLTPEIIRPEFVARIAKLGKMTPHFHLSMQSGCDRTLAAMKRRYNTRMVLDGMNLLRKEIPSVMFTTDMMVGFPGESDDDFLETLDFVRKARFLDMHVFAYSKRKNTPAADYPFQVDEIIKHERSKILTGLASEITGDILDSVVSEKRRLSVVFETEENGVWTGHSREYIEVQAPFCGNIHGAVLDVIPEAVSGKSIIGKILK